MMPEEANAANEELIKAYRVTFKTPWAHPVMMDLMAFCHFRTPADNQIEEGMRRVFLRIVQFTQLEPEQLLRLYAGQPIPTTGENDG